MRRNWWETIKERQAVMREKNEAAKQKKKTPTAKRNTYQWGAKDYLANFQIGEAREYNEHYSWESLKSVASKLKRVYGVQYVFSTIGIKRYISRLL